MKTGIERLLQRSGKSGLRIPEWNFRTGELENICSVEVKKLSSRKNDFYGSSLTTYSEEISQIKREFERFKEEGLRRVQGVNVGRDINLPKALDYMVAVRSGTQPDENIYQDVRRKKRDVSVGILMDVSGSTRYRDRLTMIKHATVFAAEAFEFLGDNYAIFAYTSRSWNPHDLLLIPLSDFGYQTTEKEKSVLGNLQGCNLTPTGPAIRFMAEYMKQIPDRTKVLLVVTDGEPQYHEDFDPTERKYAFQDTRHAFLAAKKKGLHTFCISIDTNSETRNRLDSLYGKNTHTHLSNARDLPQGLINFYKRVAF